MLSPFKQLQLIKAEVFMSMPGRFRQKTRSAWSDPNRQGAEVECFLEGPSFDRDIRRLMPHAAPLTPAEIDANFDHFETEDYRIGYDAFIGKTKPKFKGR